MQQIELITGLPSRLTCIILQDWLNLKSVVALDSAYCCHVYREEFLDLLQSDEYIVEEQVVILQNSTVSSLLRRFGEKIRSVKLDYSFTPAQEDLVKKHCHNLTHIEFWVKMNCTPDLRVILRTNPRIKYLSIMHGNFDRNSTPFNRSFEGLVLPKLTTLALKNYQIDNENILDLIKKKILVRLDLSYCDISSSIFLQIAHLCPRLKILKLAESIRLTDASLNEVTAACPHIEHLDISWAEQITDDGIISAVQNLKGLQSLNIEAIDDLTDISLDYIGRYCATTLHTLWMNCSEGNFMDTSYPRFSAAAINELLERCTQLRTLYLYTDGLHVRFSTASIQNLTYLSLSGGVTSDENLITVGTYGINLHILKLNGYEFYARDALAAIVNGCPRLKALYYRPFPCLTWPDCPTYLSPSYWMNIRPQLKVIGFQSVWYSTRHDVMNMNM